MPKEINVPFLVGAGTQIFLILAGVLGITDIIMRKRLRIRTYVLLAGGMILGIIAMVKAVGYPVFTQQLGYFLVAVAAVYAAVAVWCFIARKRPINAGYEESRMRRMLLLRAGWLLTTCAVFLVFGGLSYLF